MKSAIPLLRIPDWCIASIFSLSQSRYARQRPELLKKSIRASKLLQSIPPWTKIRCIRVFTEAQDLGVHLRTIKGPKHWVRATDTILQYCQYSGYLPLELQSCLRDQ